MGAPPPKQSARQEALALIGRRPHFTGELRERLAEKGHSDADIEDAIELLNSYKYLNDDELAAQVVEESKRSLRGPGWVRQRLLQRGASEQLAEAQAEAARNGEIQRALKALQKRFPGDEIPADEADKAFRYLENRGFSASVVTDIIEQRISRS